MTRDQLRDQLVASLEYAGNAGGISWGDDAERGYFDWSCPIDRTDDSKGRRFEMGDGGDEAISLDLTFDEIRQLHAALTALLLAHTK